MSEHRSERGAERISDERSREERVSGDEDSAKDVLDPAQFDVESSDVGGPGSALGSGVEAALTGGDAESGDEGRASTEPRPSGD